LGSGAPSELGTPISLSGTKPPHLFRSTLPLSERLKNDGDEQFILAIGAQKGDETGFRPSLGQPVQRELRSVGLAGGEMDQVAVDAAQLRTGLGGPENVSAC